MSNKKIIIVPDVHGRSFWRPLIKYLKDNQETTVIFLGDYLDPYPWEGISKEDAIAVFEEIIDFKNAFPNNVVLLLGNHDFGPYISEDMPACRSDWRHLTDIRHMFMSNLDKFDIGWYTTQNNKNFLFTHSCLIKAWVEYVNKREKESGFGVLFKKPSNVKNIVDTLNQCLHNDFERIRQALGTVSFSRGGRYPYGSLVWAHWDEIDLYSKEFRGWYQIFGHSQQISYEMEKDIYENGNTDKLANPIITDYFACLDCKQLFVLENGKINKFIS
jgi:hypothetical protein